MAGTIFPSYILTDCLVQTISFGFGGKLTLNNPKSECSINKAMVSFTKGANSSKLGSVLPTGVLKAIPFIPNKTACFAAANVPECHIELPKLGPMLIPDNTKDVLG
ncbi:hypothetical protein D3C86_1795010 [compost metagenome]